MTQRVTEIHQNSKTSASIAEKSRTNSDTLLSMAHRLEGVVRQFRI